MYEYSPIKKIYVKNFRNIGEATVEFDESPIISLIGDNEAGKTSIVKAFATCALHAYPRDQKGFIRDGTNGFGVYIELEDGSKVTRIKTPTLNKYTVETPDGKVWDTNKIDSGLPVAVQNIMGLIEEPETKEFLQVRTYEDQLLFVVTPASTNYKVMYDALKVDQLTRAIKMGSQESNALKAAIGDSDASVKTLTDSLRSIRTLDLEPLINIKNRLVKQQKSVDCIESVVRLKNKMQSDEQSLGAIGLIAKTGIKEINILLVDRLVSANRVLKENNRLVKISNNYSNLDTIENIDTTLLNKIVKVMEKREELRVKTECTMAYKDLSQLNPLSEYRVKALNNIVAVKDKVNRLEKLYSVMDSTGADFITQDNFDVVNKSSKAMQLIARNKLLVEAAKESDTIIKQINDYLKAIGAAVASCPNCGETVVMEVGR